MKTRKWSRIPSELEIANFDGMHCNKIYQQAVASGWHCPCCGRSAQQLIRWTEIRGTWFRAKYADEHGMGFTIAFALHHCHGYGRFETTLICGDCNTADGTAKRKLGLPKSWSFSPSEIRQFVTVAPYSGKITIDYAKAKQLYEQRSWAVFEPIG